MVPNDDIAMINHHGARVKYCLKLGLTRRSASKTARTHTHTHDCFINACRDSPFLPLLSSFRAKFPSYVVSYRRHVSERQSECFKKIALSSFVMGNVECVVCFRNSIPCPLPGAATGQVQRSDSFMNKSSLRHHI
jgi:Zn ribbon nucleic-acid-binding protein